MRAAAARWCYYADQPTNRPDCRLVATARVGHIPLCPSCLFLRSTLGKGEAVRPLPPPGGVDTNSPLDRITQVAAELRVAEQALAGAVHRARQRGYPWVLISQRLG